MLNAQGQEVRGAVLASGFEDRALLAFEIPAASKGLKYWIYFGNPNAKPSALKLDASAVSMLEVRELPEGAPSSWDDVQKLIRSAKVLGRALWPRLEVNFNPYGPWDKGLYIFSGRLDCPLDGTYGFQSNAQAATFISIDGALAVDWPGWHNAKRPSKHNNQGEIELKKGPHKIEYVNAFNIHGACLAGWRKPGDKGYTPIPSTDFAGVLYAAAGPAESRAGALADFDWHIVDDLGMEGRSATAVQFALHANAGAKIVKWDFGDGAVSFTENPLHVFMLPANYKISCDIDGKSVVQSAAIRPRHGARGKPYERRVVEYAAIVKDYPLDGFPERACFEIALLCHEAGKFDAAVRAFRAAFEKGWAPRDGDEAWWPIRVYELYRDAGKYDDAIWVCDWLAARNSNGESAAMALNLKAEILYDYQDKVDAAAEVCKEILSKYGQANTDYVRLAYIRLGDYALARGDRALAKSTFDEAQNSPKWKKWSGDLDVTEGAHELNFMQYLRSREYDAALKEITSLEWKTPSAKLSGETRFMRGRIDMARQLYAQALKEFERAELAERRAPFADELLYLRALAYEGLNQTQRARETFGRLVKEFPESNFSLSAREKLKK